MGLRGLGWGVWGCFVGDEVVDMVRCWSDWVKLFFLGFFELFLLFVGLFCWRLIWGWEVFFGWEDNLDNDVGDVIMNEVGVDVVVVWGIKLFFLFWRLGKS